ncbi:MAG: PAS domain-containing protein [Spirochaetaceae bacterium]|nr:PAS domain-containing protein [Spirochaetaceae bacterium]
MSFFVLILIFGSFLILSFLIWNHLRIQKYKELKRREQQYKALSVSNDGFYDWNIQNNTIHFDSNYYKMAGYESEEFPGNYHEWYKRVHPEDSKRTIKEINALLIDESSKYDVEFRFKRKDGSWMWIRSRGIISERDKSGKILRVLGTHSDITKAKNAESELKRLYFAIEQADEIIMITNVSGVIQYVNASFTRVTEYTKEEAIGQNARLIKSGEQNQSFYQNLWETITSGKSWNGIIKNKKKGGDLYTEKAAISPVRDIDGSLVNFVAIKRDISKELSFEEQLLQSQKMQAIGQLAGGVAHDFNNMLTGILTASLMLRKISVNSEKALKYLGIIDEAVERSAGLTKNLLSFSREKPQLLTIIDIHHSINKTVNLLKSTLSRSIRFELNLHSPVSAIIGDPSQIENSILNLGINASHAISDEGLISISTEIVFFDQSYCEENIFDLEAGDYIHIQFKDDGQGIHKENLVKIFEPFFTTKEISKGTGLGLTSVYGMIKQHKGSISVESEENRGTCFHLYFPLINHDIEVTHPDQPNTFNKIGEGSILLVDDENLIRTPLKELLQDVGYRVLIANDGEMAVEIYRAHSDEIDVVILDIIMPKMNGCNCLKILRSINPNVKVIVESGSSSLDNMDKMRELGIQGTINKPSSEDEILREVQRVLITIPSIASITSE